eukprot:8344669-Alexandrium_andersonii.AAC.1
MHSDISPWVVGNVLAELCADGAFGEFQDPYEVRARLSLWATWRYDDWDFALGLLECAPDHLLNTEYPEKPNRVLNA